MGKGGGKAHTPREAKDNLKSTQMMSVIDAIGEGPIEGPVKGLQSILVNKTPLTDTDGNPVIHGVTAVWRAGDLSHSFYFCRKVSCTEGVLDIGKS